MFELYFNFWVFSLSTIQNRSSRYTYKDFRKQAKIVRILTFFFFCFILFSKAGIKKMLLLRFNYEIWPNFLVLCSLLLPPISLEIYSSSKSILEAKKKKCLPAAKNLSSSPLTKEVYMFLSALFCTAKCLIYYSFDTAVEVILWPKSKATLRGLCS